MKTAALTLVVGLAAGCAVAEDEGPPNVLTVGTVSRSAHEWATGKLALDQRRTLGQKLAQSMRVDLGLQLWDICTANRSWECKASAESWSTLMGEVLARQDTTDAERQAFLAAARSVLQPPQTQDEVFKNYHWIFLSASVNSGDAAQLLRDSVQREFVPVGARAEFLKLVAKMPRASERVQLELVELLGELEPAVAVSVVQGFGRRKQISPEVLQKLRAYGDTEPSAKVREVVATLVQGEGAHE